MVQFASAVRVCGPALNSGVGVPSGEWGGGNCFSAACQAREGVGVPMEFMSAYCCSVVHSTSMSASLVLVQSRLWQSASFPHTMPCYGC